MQSVSKDFLNPLLCSPDDSAIRPGDMVRLALTDSIPNLPSPITAVVQNPILRVNLIHPTTGCRVSGYRYTFLYDEADLNEIVSSIDECDIISVACVTCCELLEEQLASETLARVAADEAEAAARIAGDAASAALVQAEAATRLAADNAEIAARIAGDKELVLVETETRWHYDTVREVPELDIFADQDSSCVRLTLPTATVTPLARDCVIDLQVTHSSGSVQTHLLPENPDGELDASPWDGQPSVNDAWVGPMTGLGYDARVGLATTEESFSRIEIAFSTDQSVGLVTINFGTPWVYDLSVEGVGPFTPTQIAQFIADAINGDSWLPVEASAFGGVVNLIAKDPGPGLNGTPVSSTIVGATFTPSSSEFAGGFEGGLVRWAITAVGDARAYYEDGELSSPDAGFPGVWTSVDSSFESIDVLQPIVPPSVTFHPQVILQQESDGPDVVWRVLRSNCLTRSFLSRVWKVERAMADIWGSLPAAGDAALAPICWAGADTVLGAGFDGGPTALLIGEADVTLDFANAAALEQTVPNPTQSVNTSAPLVTSLAFFPAPGDANNELYLVSWESDGGILQGGAEAQRSFTRMALCLAGNRFKASGSLTVSGSPTPAIIGHPTVIEAVAELTRKGWAITLPNFIGY